MSPDRLRRAFGIARDALLAERTPAGHWVGELSTSALSTAVAVSALALAGKAGPGPGSGTHDDLIAGGLDWLATHQNADGGWGDTVKSFSNISTTMLARAAFHITGRAGRYPAPLEASDAWLTARYGPSPAERAEAVRARYGTDRTFSVPILMTSALAGLVDWREVPSLPFELATLPQSWYRFAGLPVVSYALPALIAIGQSVYHNRGSWNPLALLVRGLAIRPSLRVLAAIQPPNGGFLEATPLTSFVALGLASSGQARHPVVGRCLEFIVASRRPDGSWPIDTDLSTWVTTLGVNALAGAGVLGALDRRDELLDWLLAQQYQVRHPFTGADPGAWAWTPLPGAVPDADDTPGALLALRNLLRVSRPQALPGPDAPGETTHDRAARQAAAGVRWLLDLQNRDGGWPTFCRGWGKLPFDRSGTDLTAHALRALDAWPEAEILHPGTRAARERGLAYLAREQRTDGSWLPLWFGNQHVAEDANPTFGTARVLACYRDLGLMETEPARRGVAWLLANQEAEGGWSGAKGGPASVEETSLALEGVLAAGPAARAAAERGLEWLVERIEAGALKEPAPVGFYFAKLWYFERMYPLVWATGALGRALR